MLEKLEKEPESLKAAPSDLLFPPAGVLLHPEFDSVPKALALNPFPLFADFIDEFP